MVCKLDGNWSKGLAYDIHTLKSEYLGQDAHGHDIFENTRSPMGELVYKLKYHGDTSVVGEILNLLSKEVDFSRVDVIIPIPPSNKNRIIQPVYIIATAIGERFGVQVCQDAIIKLDGSHQLKEITDSEQRITELKKYMRLTNKYDLDCKTVLLLDDLYRSGSTLNVATELLLKIAKVKKVYVLAMTKTRSNR
jgi:predicted amidophosphoribosyltransferase